MKNMFVVLLMTFVSSASFAAQKSGQTYICEGTQKLTEGVFVEAKIILSKTTLEGYELSLELDGNKFGENYPCELDPRASGVRGRLSLICTEKPDPGVILYKLTFHYSFKFMTA